MSGRPHLRFADTAKGREAALDLGANFALSKPLQQTRFRSVLDIAVPKMEREHRRYFRYNVDLPVRRRWPATLVSWSRLLAGGFRDPLVGRDVLVGCLFAAFLAALGGLGWFVPSWLGYLPPQPQSGPQSVFLGARTIIAYMSYSLFSEVFLALANLFVLFFLRVLLRKDWAAAIAFVLLTTVFFSSWSQFNPVVLVINVIVDVLTVFLLIRFGLLALVATWVFAFLTTFPLTSQASAWYAGISLTGILLMAALALYGFYTSLGGRPVFGGAVLVEE